MAGADPCWDQLSARLVISPLGTSRPRTGSAAAGHVPPPWPPIGRLAGCGALIGGAATPASPAWLVSPGLSRWRDLLLSVQVSTVMSSVNTGSS